MELHARSGVGGGCRAGNHVFRHLVTTQLTVNPVESVTGDQMLDILKTLIMKLKPVRTFCVNTPWTGMWSFGSLLKPLRRVVS